MTTHPEGRHPAVAEFAAALRRFHTECGAPSYRSLVKTSQRLQKLYPDLGERDLPHLSGPAISETLGGRRARPPRTAWVLVFVLSCQRRAWEEGMLDTDPGPATTREWMRRLRHVLAALAEQGRAQP
jgi:hypothetical protein